MEMILLGTYKSEENEMLILYCENMGKCMLLNKKKDMDIFLYSYFDKLNVSINKFNNIINVETLGPCNMKSFIENIKFASNNLRVLNSPKENNLIIYLEDLDEVVELDEKYIIKFYYRNENYGLNISDENIIRYLLESESNIKILNDYLKNSKIILVIRKDSLGNIDIIKMHSIKMGMKL